MAIIAGKWTYYACSEVAFFFFFTPLEAMNTANKLGPHTQTDRGTCPGVGLRVYYKAQPLRSRP